MTKRLWIVAATLAVVVAIGTATAAYVTQIHLVYLGGVVTLT